MDDNSIAFEDGYNAHKNGVSVDANPYDEASQERSHHQWTSGWCHRFSLCKHNGEPIHTDEQFSPVR